MSAQPLRAISSMATRQVLAELLPAFEQQTGTPVALESVGGVEAARRIQAGEAFDVVLLGADAITQLTNAGRLLGGSRVDWALSPVAVAVRAGAPVPDIQTESALRALVQNAQSISLSTGPSGVALTQLFARWGLADAVAARLVQAPPGVPVGTLVAQGTVELGFQQRSELLHVDGITLLGNLPPPVQITTTFSAAVAVGSPQTDAARRLLAYLGSPEAAPAIRRQGMEPA